MSTLTDAQVGQVCREAGFVGPDLVTAIGCAYASSGAIPGYDYRIDPGPLAHYKGLWGVDTVEWPDTAGRELHSPYVAAAVAHELTDATGGWDWCPAYRAGTHRHYEARATAAAGRLPYRELTIEPNPIPTFARAGRQHLVAAGRLLDTIADYRSWRHDPWQTTTRL